MTPPVAIGLAYALVFGTLMLYLAHLRRRLREAERAGRQTEQAPLEERDSR